MPLDPPADRHIPSHAIDVLVRARATVFDCVRPALHDEVAVHEVKAVGTVERERNPAGIAAGAHDELVLDSLAIETPFPIDRGVDVPQLQPVVEMRVLLPERRIRTVDVADVRGKLVEADSVGAAGAVQVERREMMLALPATRGADRVTAPPRVIPTRPFGVRTEKARLSANWPSFFSKATGSFTASLAWFCRGFAATPAGTVCRSTLAGILGAAAVDVTMWPGVQGKNDRKDRRAKPNGHMDPYPGWSAATISEVSSVPRRTSTSIAKDGRMKRVWRCLARTAAAAAVLVSPALAGYHGRGAGGACSRGRAEIAGRLPGKPRAVRSSVSVPARGSHASTYLTADGGLVDGPCRPAGPLSADPRS